LIIFHIVSAKGWALFRGRSVIRKAGPKKLLPWVKLHFLAHIFKRPCQADMMLGKDRKLMVFPKARL